MKRPVLTSLILLASLTAGCGEGGPRDETRSGSSLSGRSADTKSPSSTNPAPQYMQATDKVESLGRSKYKDIYAGVVVHDHGNASSLQAYLTQVSSTAEADFHTAAGSVPIVFRSATESQESLDELEARLSDATPDLWKDAVRITVSWPHTQTGRLHVEVVHLKRCDRKRIEAAIGSDLFDVVNANGLAVFGGIGRLHTTSP